MSTTMTDVYDIPQEHRDFLAGIRELVQGVVAPRAADIDRTGEYPWDIREALGSHDILALPPDALSGVIRTPKSIGPAT